MRLTLSNDPAKRPAGTVLAGLAIAKMREDGMIQLAANIQLDAANRTVSGDITGFSSDTLFGRPPPSPRRTTPSATTATCR